jgi:hypothetical protein
MKCTIELNIYSLDELRDLEEETETFIYIHAKEELRDFLMYQYRVIKLCFFNGMISESEYVDWLMGVCGGDDEYWEGQELSATEIADVILNKAISSLESLQ